MCRKLFFHYLPVWLASAAVLLFLSLSAMAGNVPEVGVEMIDNGDFSDPLKFQLYKESGGNATISAAGGELLIDVKNVGRVSHAIQPYYDGFQLYQNAEYQLDFDVRSTLPRDLYVRIQLNGGDYHHYFERFISVSEEMRHFEFSFVMQEQDDPAPRFCINMGYVDTMSAAGLKPEEIAPHQVYFDNISLKMKDASGISVKADNVVSGGIRIDQVGYLPNAVKTAVFADLAADHFTVVDTVSGKTVFEGTLSAPVEDPYAGETNRVADFSELTSPGTYKLVGSDGSESPEFAVSEKIYDDLLRSAIKLLYLQRCGTELDTVHAGSYAHPVCHSELALVYGTDRRIDVSGGWHDAGDYGRYVVPGAKAAADLLLSYELNSGLIDDAGIPERGDGVDDRLQEAQYELEWMLKMQAETGGVYHKVTARGFPGFVMPQEETDELVVSPVSVTATADFAGVMALASRVYSGCGVSDLSSRADHYLAAAEKAWTYLENHPNEPGFTNPAEIVTGEYPDGKDRDERFWAAAELFRTAGKEKYRKAVSELLSSGGITAELGWEEMGGYGLLALVNDPQIPENDALRVRALDILRAAVQNLTQRIHSHSYAVSRTDSFEWGSNMEIANEGVLLLIGASLFDDASLRDDASRQLDYLLGENPTGYCYVTGFGSKSPEHPHHRPSVAYGSAVPGMLVGGPDNGLHDPYAQSVLSGCAPAKCYVDNDQSYSTNEICIYWNSPLVLLLSVLTAAD